MIEERITPPLKALLEAIERYERGEMAVDALQTAVRLAEDSVTEHALRDLRRFLRSAEGKLELIRFTVDGEHVFGQAVKVAQEVGSQVRTALGQEN